MSWWVTAISVGIPLAWHLGITAATYWDSGRVDMPRRKSTAIVFALPLIGAFWYLMERSELSYDPSTDPYRQGEYNVHPSRRDDDERE